ncbi:spermidine synthase [Oceanicoccus sp. KOV_DT_Chl]|uniref:spermidine synthase n=1 Tax=Oceanicoccus sp. KOV_DT_Chl TaxID=1904639 RepID=UPI000C7BA7D6|nr:spermidine synthase [Oceanicoccus sp. KOV_DT_Chl]
MSLGREIYHHHDEFGPLIVFDDGNKRYLAFGAGDEQSCSLKSNPFLLQHDYSQAMLLVLLFIQPRRLTLLGLGGGCLVTTLHQYLPDINITAVELRPHVVKIAQRFFQLPRSSRLSIVVDDASEFLETHEGEKVDVLFGDIYDAEGLDLQQTQPWFIEACYQQLEDDGWLVLNCWRHHRGEQEMMDTLTRLFADVRTCSTIEGNWVVLAGKKANTISVGQLKNDAKKWSKVLGYSLLPSLGRLQQWRAVPVD